MDTKTTLKDWIPFLSKFIYPIIAVLVILIYRPEITEFYQQKIMDENSDVKLNVGGFSLKIKQKAKQTPVKNLGFYNIGLNAMSNSEFRPTSEEEANKFVTKATSHELVEVLNKNKRKASFETLISTLRHKIAITVSNGNLKYIVTQEALIAKLVTAIITTSNN